MYKYNKASNYISSHVKMAHGKVLLWHNVWTSENEDTFYICSFHFDNWFWQSRRYQLNLILYLWELPLLFGAHFTFHFLFAFHIRWTLNLAVIQMLIIRSQQISVLATTAKLSCYVQNFVVITLLKSRWQDNKIGITFELWGQNPWWNVPLPCQQIQLSLWWHNWTMQKSLIVRDSSNIFMVSIKLVSVSVIWIWCFSSPAETTDWTDSAVASYITCCTCMAALVKVANGV